MRVSKGGKNRCVCHSERVVRVLTFVYHEITLSTECEYHAKGDTCPFPLSLPALVVPHPHLPFSRVTKSRDNFALGHWADEFSFKYHARGHCAECERYHAKGYSCPLSLPSLDSRAAYALLSFCRSSRRCSSGIPIFRYHSYERQNGAVLIQRLLLGEFLASVVNFVSRC